MAVAVSHATDVEGIAQHPYRLVAADEMLCWLRPDESGEGDEPRPAGQPRQRKDLFACPLLADWHADARFAGEERC
jgi:hypothetical protein